MTLDNIEFAVIVGAATITGGAGQNYVIGDSSAQSILLGALDDTLLGGGGDDMVASAFGEDLLYGNLGNHTVKGGGGQDTLYGGQGSDTIEGQNDADTLFGNRGADTVNGGQGVDLIYGNQGGDVISGASHADTLFGGQGDDVLYGNTGVDILRGGIGADVLYGGQDADTLFGGAGVDRLFGGAGSDSFSLAVDDGADQVLDFSIFQDDRLQIDIAGTLITSLGELEQNLSTDASGNLLVDIGGDTSLTLVGLGVSDAANIGVDLVSGGSLISTGRLDGTETISANSAEQPDTASATRSTDHGLLMAGPSEWDFWS